MAGSKRACRGARYVALLVAGALLVASPTAAQEPPHRAGLVVVHGDGRAVTRCVSFAEEAITGVDLLRRSGLSVTLSAFGGLGYGVCAIDGEGCQAENCFCQCQGSPCAYWVYSHRQPDGSWAISGVGASSWQLRDGDVDGWVWGDGSTAPPPLPFEAICPEDAAPPPTEQQPSPTAAGSPTAPSTPPPSPTHAIATATPAPPSVTATPTTPPGPSPTVPPTPNPTILPTPTDRPPVSSPTPTSQPAAASGVSPAGYAFFGLFTLGLVGLLLYVLLRQK